MIADTTLNTTNEAQISIVVRYITVNKQVECLLSFMVFRDKSRNGHATKILRCLDKHSVDVGEVFFQCYDFTACVSGEYNGCHKKLRVHNLSALENYRQRAGFRHEHL